MVLIRFLLSKNIMFKRLNTLLLLTFFSLFHFTTLADEVIPKDFFATRIRKAPKIDGVLDEEVWKHVRCPATGFVQRSPNPGKFPSAPSEVRVLYEMLPSTLGLPCMMYLQIVLCANLPTGIM